MHDSLQQLVNPYVDTCFDNLPPEVLEEVAKAFAASSWDASSPAGRAAWARRTDEMREARRAELAQAMSIHMYWFNLQGEILNTERQIADLPSSTAASAIPGDLGCSALATLQAKLAVLQEKWDQPDDLAAKAQLAAEMATLGQVPAVLDISKALQFLAESTGAVWTDAHLLSLVSNSDVSFYAVVPPWTPMYISEWKNHGLRHRPFVKPGRPVLAMLGPDHARELWVHGQTNCSTWVAADDFSLDRETVFLENPVAVSRADVRLTPNNLLQILKKWEASRQPIGPVPNTTPVPTWIQRVAGKSMTHKLRTNSLDAPIKKAVAKAGSLATGPVYLELRELALSGEPPFLGTTDGDSLCYTNDKNEPAKLTKNALAKRLKTHHL